MEKLCDLFRHLGNSLNLEETFSTLDRELRRLVDYEAISLHLVESGLVVPAYASGLEFRSLASLEAHVGEGFLGRAAEECRFALNEDVEGLGRLDVACVVPVEQSGLATAVLSLYRSRPRPFSEADRDILQGLVPKLAASIENARNYRRIEQLAGIDSLTKLLNARSLFQRLDAELARARRVKDRLGVLQCAVEGIHESNIRQIAAGLSQNCREYDFAARSENEFVLVLPGFWRGDLGTKRARLATTMEEIGLGVGLPLSIHIGAAFFPEDGSDAEDLLAVASQRLHLARQDPPRLGHGIPRA